MITERLSRFVAETGAADIPPGALGVARAAITDYVGVTLAGSGEEAGRIVTEYAARTGGNPAASVIGGGFKTAPYLAALANGTMGHAMDYDDGGGFGHASVVLAPAVLAAGESTGASGRDVLAAYVIGFETATCIHRAVGSRHYRQGFHGTSTTGSLGATAAVAWLLKLESRQVRMALGIAGSLASGLRQNFGTMTKPLHAGNAAANGVKAALLAQGGFTADENIIEAPLGFARVLGYDAEVDWEKTTTEMGKPFHVLFDGHSAMYFKLYPSCADTHAGIDAALQLRAEHPINPDDIAGIELGVDPGVKSVLIHHHPRTGLEGKFSLEYTVARALLSGEVAVRHFTEESVNESAAQRLIEKMHWDEKYPEPPSGRTKVWGLKSVTVKLQDGSEYSREVRYARGTRENPPTREEMAAKYRDCAAMVLSPEDVSASESLLAGLERVAHIGELMEIIVKKRGG